MPRKRQTSTELMKLFSEVSDVESDEGDDLDFLAVRPPWPEVPIRHEFLPDDDSDLDDFLAQEAAGAANNRYSPAKRMPVTVYEFLHSDGQLPCTSAQAMAQQSPRSSVSYSPPGIDIEPEFSPIQAPRRGRGRAHTSAVASTSAASTSAASTPVANNSARSNATLQSIDTPRSSTRQSRRMTIGISTPRSSVSTPGETSFTSRTNRSVDLPDFTPKNAIGWGRRGELDGINTETDFLGVRFDEETTKDPLHYFLQYLPLEFF